MTFSANQACRPKNVWAEGPGVLPAKGNALVIVLPRDDPFFHSQSSFGPTGPNFDQVSQMSVPVDISFDCLPLRSITRFDVPLDASPGLQSLCLRIKQAAEKHGLHNTYYLHNGRCRFQLTNDPQIGMLEFQFEGTILTDADDLHARYADLIVEVRQEVCDWLTEPAVAWFRETVRQAVLIEFGRYIAAGDLQKTIDRMQRLQATSDAQGGFIGLGL